jgi:ATP-dependent helicase/nuclease subunit A
MRAAAAKRAAAFPRRTLPSSLTVHADADVSAEALAKAEPERRLDADPEWDENFNAAAREYGTWWHETVERMAWHLERSTWEEIFKARLPLCAQQERAKRDWKLFLASALPARLSQAEQIVQAEMPFLVQQDERTCLEGVIDLALFDKAQQRWTVIDWKTNEVTAATVDSLREIYAPQVQAYAQALQKITGHPAECGVYSTAVGVWLPC